LSQAVEYPHRRFQILLRSTMGPIDVYLVRSVIFSCPGSSLIFNSFYSVIQSKNPFQAISDYCNILGGDNVAVGLKESLRR